MFNSQKSSKPQVTAPVLRSVQINLNHSKTASENLLIFLNENNIDVSFIQEPWIRSSKVMGLQHKDFNLFYNVLHDKGKPRACMV